MLFAFSLAIYATRLPARAAFAAAMFSGDNLFRRFRRAYADTPAIFTLRMPPRRLSAAPCRPASSFSFRHFAALRACAQRAVVWQAMK